MPPGGLKRFFFLQANFKRPYDTASKLNQRRNLSIYLRTLIELPDHSNLSTTLVYLHLQTHRCSRIINPLDYLNTQQMPSWQEITHPGSHAVPSRIERCRTADFGCHTYCCTDSECGSMQYLYPGCRNCYYPVWQQQERKSGVKPG